MSNQSFIRAVSNVGDFNTASFDGKNIPSGKDYLPIASDSEIIKIKIGKISVTISKPNLIADEYYTFVIYINGSKALVHMFIDGVNCPSEGTVYIRFIHNNFDSIAIDKVDVYFKDIFDTEASPILAFEGISACKPINKYKSLKKSTYKVNVYRHGDKERINSLLEAIYKLDDSNAAYTLLSRGWLLTDRNKCSSKEFPELKSEESKSRESKSRELKSEEPKSRELKITSAPESPVTEDLFAVAPEIPSSSLRTNKSEEI